MSLSIRYYLFPDGAEPLRLSQRLVDGLTHGKDALPQYAGTRQKVMGVVLDNRDGKPAQIDRTHGSIWTFDDDGQIKAGLQQAVAHAMNSFEDPSSANATVVSLQPKLSRKKLQEEFRWEPTKADIERIIQDIWPKTKASRLKEAKGVSQRTPPLTYEGKRAIEQTTQHFWQIPFEIGKLKEPALKGFVFETRKRAKEDLEYQHLFEALARMGEDQLALAARRKSGRGIWYAVVEVMHQREDYIETIRVIRERCEGRKAAVVAARRLLAENAHLLDENISLETTTITDIEWEAMAAPDDLAFG